MNLLSRKLNRIVLALCALAALRVFIYAAVFPFFNNVDEQPHVDLVFKYSHGNIPRGIEPFASETARYLALYRTPEYFVKPEDYGGHYPPPNWELPREELEKVLSQEVPIWESRANHESGEPPVYYAIAGIWMDLGRGCGLQGLTLLYWIRFLNLALAAILVWIGFLAAKSVFPDNQFVQIGVPALLTLWPQSAFYSIQADALSPVFFGIAFLGMIKIVRSERLSIFVSVWAGLALAATCLVKTSNFPLPLVAIALLAQKLFVARKREPFTKRIVSLSAFILSIAIPLTFWFAWNLQHFGDLTATKTKIDLLGWTPKAVTEWLPHPIFTLHGFIGFWRELLPTFWRGEFVWHLERMASGIADAFYAASTGAVVVVMLVLLLRKSVADKNQRWALSLALLSFLSIVAFMVLLSLKFDFGNSPYPSREHPYFVSGRLLNAAAVPFFLLFVLVIDRIGRWSKSELIRWSLLAATAVVVLVSQLQVNAPAFSSHYNFFHRGNG